ncbi:MAG TPA: Asp23/Gls24 family envelope stress response protein [Candidatus Limnocylindria bacterium]|nr:Asp23/Gls24 family envelope stress response protein [Candidatus Limnocylindria bacterium]
MAKIKDNLPVNAEGIAPDGGSITYANEVIAIITGIAASEVEGIAGMVTAGGIGEIISKNRNVTRGVKVEVGSEEVSVDLYAIVEYGQPIQKVASEVQENVRKSIESMTGLRVARVDVHVQGVSFEKDKQDAQSRLAAANIPQIAAPAKKDRKAEKAGREDGGKADAEPRTAMNPVEIVPDAPEAEAAPAQPEEEIVVVPEADDPVFSQESPLTAPADETPYTSDADETAAGGISAEDAADAPGEKPSKKTSAKRRKA